MKNRICPKFVLRKSVANIKFAMFCIRCKSRWSNMQNRAISHNRIKSAVVVLMANWKPTRRLVCSCYVNNITLFISLEIYFSQLYTKHSLTNTAIFPEHNQFLCLLRLVISCGQFRLSLHTAENFFLNLEAICGVPHERG